MLEIIEVTLQWDENRSVCRAIIRERTAQEWKVTKVCVQRLIYGRAQGFQTPEGDDEGVTGKQQPVAYKHGYGGIGGVIVRGGGTRNRPCGESGNGWTGRGRIRRGMVEEGKITHNRTATRTSRQNVRSGKTNSYCNEWVEPVSKVVFRWRPFSWSFSVVLNIFFAPQMSGF